MIKTVFLTYLLIICCSAVVMAETSPNEPGSDEYGGVSPGAGSYPQDKLKPQAPQDSDCISSNTTDSTMDSQKKSNCNPKPDTPDLLQLAFIESMKADYNWKHEYTVAALKAFENQKTQILLDPNTQIQDPELYYICPNFNNLNKAQKKIFWILLLSSMAMFESAYNNNSVAYNDGGGNTSIGLLQLSYEDMDWAKDWGCNVNPNDANNNLMNGSANVNCALAIMSRQLYKEQYHQRKIFINDENTYWAVLRPQDIAQSSNNVITTFNKYKKLGAPFCN